MCKYVFITGGVVSGLGKGITAASLGRLLVNRGLKVSMQKMDPYLNVDPSIMSPFEHGEVFVTNDGSEVDLDIGHYERFLGINCDQHSDYTSGKIYSALFEKERKGAYWGKTVQVVPHLTNEIKEKFKSAGSKDTDVVIIEIGGTVGDMEGLAYLEAMRQLRSEKGGNSILLIHVVLLPYLETSQEIKTKPAQNSVKDLTHLGLQPDMLICRTNHGIKLTEEVRKKLAMFCNLSSKDDVVHNMDCNTIYEVPLKLKEQNFDDIVLKKLGIKAKSCNMKEWTAMVENMQKPYKEVNIAVVGKYTAMPDAYLSVAEALRHAGFKNSLKVNMKLISSEDIEKDGAQKHLTGMHAIVVPSGFGERGIEGKIQTATYARINKIPYLGLGLGLQVAVIDFARNVAGLKGANSIEFNPKTKYPILIAGSKDTSMRLGSHPCALQKDTKVYNLYKAIHTEERHRHRYEFNNIYCDRFAELGMVFCGTNPQNNFVEMIELKDHPYFVASQFNPEFKSRPYAPHPLFVGLMQSIPLLGFYA